MTGQFRLEGSTVVQPHTQSLCQAMLLSALASLVLKNTEDGNCTVILSNLFQCLTVLSFFFYIQAEPHLFQFITVTSPTMHHCEEPGSLFSITSSQVRSLLGPPEARLALLLGGYLSSVQLVSSLRTARVLVFTAS